MMYRIDIHMHTKESSICSEISARELVETYHQKGYQTIVITDHCYERYFNEKNLTDWNEIVNYLVLGYERAKEVGDSLGVHVLFGLELTLKETDSDYLIYGLSPEKLRENPYLYHRTLKEILKLCKKENAILIQAHPFREQNTPLASPHDVHGYEVFNGSDPLENNQKACYIAEEYQAMMSSGGDTHNKQDIGKAGLITPLKITTNEELVSMFQFQQYQIISMNQLKNDHYHMRFQMDYIHNEDEFIDVLEIEENYLEPLTIASVEQVLSWEEKNHDIHIFVRDHLMNRIVGEITAVPLNHSQFTKFMNGTLEDTELDHDTLCKYHRGDTYVLLLSCVAIAPSVRKNPLILYLLLLGLRNKIKKLIYKGIHLTNICAEGQTEEGKKIIENFFHLTHENTSKDGYYLYCYPKDDIDFQAWWTGFETTLENYRKNKIIS